MAVCLFTSLPNGEYSNILIVAALSDKYFSGKTSCSVKFFYFPTFPDNKDEIKVVYPFKVY